MVGTVTLEIPDIDLAPPSTTVKNQIVFGTGSVSAERLSLNNAKGEKEVISTFAGLCRSRLIYI